MKCKNIKEITKKAKRRQSFSNKSRQTQHWSMSAIGHNMRYAISRSKVNLLNLDSVGFSAHLFKVFGKSNLKVIGVRAIPRPSIYTRGKYILGLSRKSTINQRTDI